MASFTTLNSGDALDVAISGAGLVLTQNANAAGGHQGARAIDAQSTGKFYFEFTAGIIDGSSISVGIAQASATITSAVNFLGASGVQYVSTGLTYVEGTAHFAAPSFSAGNVISIAVDLVNLEFFARVNGGQWNGSPTANPATNTGGLPFSSLGAVKPIGATGGSSTDQGGTFNFGATSFAYAVPGGFTAGWPANTNPTVNTGFFFS